MDARHTRRIKVVQELYSTFFSPLPKTADQLSHKITQKAPELDIYIDEFASKFQSDRIAKVDLAILRLALFELLHEKETPYKVVINEAVDLAHEMGGENSPAFVNAVLGKAHEKIAKN